MTDQLTAREREREREEATSLVDMRVAPPQSALQPKPTIAGIRSVFLYRDRLKSVLQVW